MCGLYAGGLIMVNVVSFALGNSAAQAGRHSGYAMAWGCLLLLVSGYYAMLETLETRLWGAPPELEPPGADGLPGAHNPRLERRAGPPGHGANRLRCPCSLCGV